MKPLFTSFLILMLSALPCMARYTLYNYSGNVSIARNGRPVELKKDMELNVLDLVIIADGGYVEIFNEQNSHIYKSKGNGEFSVTRIMIDAKGQATNHLEGINNKMRFGRSNNDTQHRVYAAKGMVSHALEIYDPEGKDFQVDPDILGRHIVSMVKDTTRINLSPFPAVLKKGKSETGGRAFRVENPLKFPIYFNIIKVKNRDAGIIEISELGQPTGCYVVLPGQALSREQFAGFDESSMHLLVMTHCYFDIDKVIEIVGKLISGENSANNTVTADTSLPLYLRTI